MRHPENDDRRTTVMFYGLSTIVAGSATLDSRRRVWFGPPGVGKSTFIAAVGGVDLEHYTDSKLPPGSVVQDVGAAGTHPEDWDPRMYMRILVLPEPKEYYRRRRLRDHSSTSKRAQADVYVDFSRDVGRYDMVLADFPVWSKSHRGCWELIGRKRPAARPGPLVADLAACEIAAFASSVIDHALARPHGHTGERVCMLGASCRSHRLLVAAWVLSRTRGLTEGAELIGKSTERMRQICARFERRIRQSSFRTEVCK